MNLHYYLFYESGVKQDITLIFLIGEKMRRRKDTKRGNNIAKEFLYLQKNYCTNCDFFSEGTCLKDKVLRQCFKENGRNK